MLSAANVQFKPDKYSTLVTVADFIRSLQERVEVLDAEHKKLLNTLLQTSNAVNGQYLPQGSASGGSASSASAAAAPSSDSMKVTDFFDDGKISPLEDDETPTFVSSLDYKAVFECCPVASAITSIDGRFLDCNPDFEALGGFLKSELLNSINRDGEPHGTAAPAAGSSRPSLPQPARSMSLFNIIRREHMERVFVAMSDMLKVPFPDTPETGAVPLTREDADADVWSGVVALVRKEGVKVRNRIYFKYTRYRVITSSRRQLLTAQLCCR
jgi:PAS domain-containing protein